MIGASSGSQEIAGVIGARSGSQEIAGDDVIAKYFRPHQAEPQAVLMEGGASSRYPTLAKAFHDESGWWIVTSALFGFSHRGKETDFKTQYQRCLEVLQKTMEYYHVALADVKQMTVFVLDSGDVGEVERTLQDKGLTPALSVVLVKGLGNPLAKISIEAQALRLTRTQNDDDGINCFNGNIASKTSGVYPVQAVKAHLHVLTSALFGVDSSIGDLTMVGAPDEVQSAVALHNLFTMLDLYGASRANIVKMTIYVVNLNRDGQTSELTLKSWAKFLEKVILYTYRHNSSNIPVLAVSEVAALPKRDAVISIEALAEVGPSKVQIKTPLSPLSAIPVQLIRTGETFYTSAVLGIDDRARFPEDQWAQALHNLDALLETVQSFRLTREHVIKLTIRVTDESDVQRIERLVADGFRRPSPPALTVIPVEGLSVIEAKLSIEATCYMYRLS